MDYDIDKIREAAGKLFDEIAGSPASLMLPKEANDAAWELYHLLNPEDEDEV